MTSSPNSLQGWSAQIGILSLNSIEDFFKQSICLFKLFLKSFIIRIPSTALKTEGCAFRAIIYHVNQLMTQEVNENELNFSAEGFRWKYFC